MPMSDMTGIDWEDAFTNAVHIPGGMGYPARWAELAQAFRKQAGGRFDLPYGPGPRERMDVFLPEGTPRGLVTFIHGGFWLAFDKSSWSHLAAGPLAHGWAVVLPSYTLAPEARIGSITRQTGRAIAAAAGLVDGPIRLAGHSAGGHLATRMVCDDSPLPESIAGRIERVASISGVHDLRPLQCHSMNEKLRLTASEAAAESPALHRRRANVDVVAWVGAAERPEFLRQSALLCESWSTPEAPVHLVAESSRHHFNVIDGLCDPDHELTRFLAGNRALGISG